MSIITELCKKKCSIVSKLLSGCLKLEIETGRYKRVPRQERLCKICNEPFVEDEIHFIDNCPKYGAIPRQIVYNQQKIREANVSGHVM